MAERDEADAAPPGDPFADLTSDFIAAFGQLIRGLRSIHDSTNPNVDFTQFALSVKRRQAEFDLAQDLFDRYVAGKVESDKLGHFVETALANAFYAEHEYDTGSRHAWLHLCQAYFLSGMATLQINITKGAHLRAQTFETLNAKIMSLIEERCPPEKWASLADIWRSIGSEVDAINDQLKKGKSKDTYAAFLRVTKRNREKVEACYLSKPVGARAGRPSTQKRRKF